MKVKIVDEQFPDLLPMTGRSSGMHISTVIKDLCVRQGIFKPRRAKEGQAPVGAGETILDSAWMQLGSALEWAIIRRFERHYEDEYIVPREQCVDALYGSPDLLHLPTYTLHEIKLTWVSSNHPHDGEKFWRYWVQLMAYCYMMKTQHGHLHVVFINGDWRSSGPKYRVYQARFTMTELKENWHMLTSHARWMKSRGHIGEVH